MDHLKRLLAKMEKYPDTCKTPVASCSDSGLRRKNCHNYYNKNTELPCRKGLVSGCRENDKPYTVNPDLLQICKHIIEIDKLEKRSMLRSMSRSRSRSRSRSIGSRSKSMGSRSRRPLTSIVDTESRKFRNRLINLGYISSEPNPRLAGKTAKKSYKKKMRQRKKGHKSRKSRTSKKSRTSRTSKKSRKSRTSKKSRKSRKSRKYKR